MKPKLGLVGLLLLVLVAVPLMAACGNEQPTSTPTTTATPTTTTTTTTPTPTPTASVDTMQPIKLRWADGSPDSGVRAESIKWLASEIERKTGGKVTFDFYWGGSLLKFTEMQQGLKAGTADVVIFASPYVPAELPLTGFMFSVPVGVGDPPTYADAVWQLLDEFPAFAQEHASWNGKTFAFHPFSPYQALSNQPIRTLDDFKGLKMRVSGEQHGKIMEAAGATAVFISFPDTYTGIQRGTVNGALSDLELMDRYKLYDVAKNVTMLNLSPIPICPYAISLDVWDKLPPDVQQIFLDTGRQLPDYVIQLLDEAAGPIANRLSDAGVQIIDFPAADAERLVNLPAVQAIAADWVADVGGKGLPAQQVRDRFLELIGK